ncbi:hypothetical protein QBC46DRAFT_415047 [Diplogelasinospora grovesii]|uniref:Uncharacterized protein n=1 Tax=Diplogelasinospora grovesii TaxID=303347 RepID=A0AAN6NI26_9PEZI|nr:hypothetical protein QBC46DRAFT_415047 [Diplogelasinospora grovesii]
MPIGIRQFRRGAVVQTSGSLGAGRTRIPRFLDGPRHHSDDSPLYSISSHLPSRAPFLIDAAPKGELHLDTIVGDLDDFEPVNEDSRQELPVDKVFNHHVAGFQSTRSDLRNGNYGLWAKLVALQGLGGEAGWATGKTDEDTYKFDGLDTMQFTAKIDYIKASMKQPEVQEHIKATDGKPVFMITGLKVARGPAVSLRKRKKLDIKNELTASGPGGVPLDTGIRANHVDETEQTMSFDTSDDFIFGIRVKKVTYKRDWLWRQKIEESNLAAEAYNKGARLVSADLEEQADDDVLELELDAEDLEGKVEVDQSGENGDEVSWIVREVRLKEIAGFCLISWDS